MNMTKSEKNHDNIFSSHLQIFLYAHIFLMDQKEEETFALERRTKEYMSTIRRSVNSHSNAIKGK